MGSKLPLLLVNVLTVSRLPAGIILATFSLSSSLHVYTAPIVAYLFASDVLDGFLARRWRVTTQAGSILDYVIDRFNCYLVISILIGKGLCPLLFTPFFLRDLLYVATQVYVSLTSLRGTKAASFVGTAMLYSYLLIITYAKTRHITFDIALVAGLGGSLLNILYRIYGVRHRLISELRSDLGI